MASMFTPVISATGLYTPPDSISNEELVTSFNTYVARFNAENADAIAAGAVEALQPSSVEFIEKASGIKARHVVSKAPILDPDIMCPRIPERPNEALSILAEMGVAAARECGMITIAWTGGTGGKLAGLVDHPFVVPSTVTARIQESHITLGHVLCELVEETLLGTAS